MANELRATYPSGTLYARVINPSGSWWNGTTFEAYSAGNYSTYDIAMTEQGSSNVYVADFPSAITTGGSYEYFVHKQAGASPAEGDIVVNTGKIDWTGTAAVSAATGSMTGSEFRDYVLRLGFKRTDKDTEIYEAATDAIQEMRRRFGFDEAEADTTTTDTISTDGDYKLDIESDLGLLFGVVVQDGTQADPLVRISKARFDELYPDAAVTSDRGYPQHFCVYAGQIYIGPLPDKTTYIYRLSYSQRAGTVSSTTAGVPFTNLYRDVLADNVLFRLYKGLGEREQAQGHLEDFERYFEQAKTRERRNSGESTFAMKVRDC